MRLSLSLRLVPAAACAWASAMLCVFVPDLAIGVGAACWGGAVASIVIGARIGGRRGRPARGATGRPVRLLVAVAALSLSAAAAAASHVALAQPARDALDDAALTGGRALTVDATVVGKVERRADGGLAFDAVAERIAAGDASSAVHAPIVVRVDPGDVDARPLLDVGARVEIRGTAAGTFPGDRAVLSVRATRGVTVREGASGVVAAAVTLRQGLLAAVDGLPGDGAGLVPGLAVGDTTAVTAELDLAMKESSLSHLTAVSGANCALVVGLAFAAAAAAGASRGGRVAAGLAALCGFVLLVTPEPSVVRAGVMAAVAMLAVVLGRPGAGMSVLSLATAALLVADPWLAGSLGFALSVSATASLLLFARPLARGLERHVPRAAALALSVPFAAQLACGPLLILIAPQVPVYGVLANLVAAPAAPVATVVGLAACLAAPFPWLQDGLVALAWLPASWIAGTARTVSSLPGDLAPWMEGWAGAATLGVVGVAVGVLIAVRRTTRPRRLAVMASAALVALVAGTVGGSALLGSVAGRWTVPQGWSVLACDVGQGDAVLLRSGEAVALIDTGPTPEALASCLDRVGVLRLDLLVLTHFDLDHAGGVAAVVGRVGTVLHGPTDADGARTVRVLRDGGARTAEVARGWEGSLGDARWRVLWPQADSRAFPAGNDASVVLDVRGGGIPPTLLLGDLSASPQAVIAASDDLAPPYAIVKVAHHGSADQHPGLYREAAPGVALVTVGAGNDYGHPRNEILDELTDLGARIARTDLSGMVAVWASGGTVSVWRERGG